VYGDQISGVPAEDAPLLGAYPYDASKVCADVIAHCYAKTFGMRVAVVRCANVYGGGDLNFSRIVPYAIQCILTEQPIVLRTDGSSRREYLYVEDAVSGMLAAGERLGCGPVSGQSFNLGSGDVLDALTLIGLMEKIAGRSAPEVIRSRETAPGEILHQSLNWSRAARVLGWRPNVKVESGLEQTIRWYRSFLGV
jgi:CDP-glucose 4,6-dehydratase